MKKQLTVIQKRNERVEADKAWETSITRRGIIAILTYVIIVIFLIVIAAPNPFVNALIPVVGFILSTLGLSLFKKIWLKKIYKK